MMIAAPFIFSLLFFKRKKLIKATKLYEILLTSPSHQKQQLLSIVELTICKYGVLEQL